MREMRRVRHSGRNLFRAGATASRRSWEPSNRSSSSCLLWSSRRALLEVGVALICARISPCGLSFVCTLTYAAPPRSACRRRTLPPDRAGEGAVRVRLAGRAERNRDRAGCARWPEVNVGGGRRPAQVLEDHVPGKRAAGAFERDRRGEGTGARGGVFCPWSVLGGAERRLQGVALGGCLGRFRRGRRLRCRHRLLAAAATGRDDRDRGEKGGPVLTNVPLKRLT